MKRGGATQIKFADIEEKSRFATYLQANLDAWRYAEGQTFPRLAEHCDISMDQLSKYLRAAAVPSQQVLERMVAANVFPDYARVESLLVDRPWKNSEPDVKMMERAAANRGKKAKPVKKAPAPAPAAVEVSAPEFEVAAPNIYEVIAADPDLGALNKTTLSAIYALMVSGATLDLDIRVLAR